MNQLLERLSIVEAEGVKKIIDELEEKHSQNGRSIISVEIPRSLQNFAVLAVIKESLKEKKIRGKIHHSTKNCFKTTITLR